jgi:hypothetical protein
MAEFITKKGIKIFYKDEVTTGQVFAMQRLAKTSKGKIDDQAAVKAMINLLIEKIIDQEGVERTDKLEVYNLYLSLPSKDGLKLMTILNSVMGVGDDGENDDPKELSDA